MPRPTFEKIGPRKVDPGVLAEYRAEVEILRLGRHAPFWRLMTTVIEKEIEAKVQQCCSLVPVGEQAGELAKAQGALDALRRLRNHPDDRVKLLGGILDSQKD